MGEVAAWLMQIDRASKVAVGQRELIHIVAAPKYIEVPKAPFYCSRVLIWNNSLVPVVDLSLLVNKMSAFYHDNSVAVGVYTDQNSGKTHYGGIQLTDMPVLDKVSNKQQILESELSSAWRPVSVSAYKSTDNEIIPILDLRRLFSPGIDKLFSL